MKTRLLACATLVTFISAAQQWQVAAPGYPYEFPRDHFNHPEFQTEWWYYTGNLQAPGGRRFGFELTFFRQAAHLATEHAAASSEKVWLPDQVYLAHLALSDINGGKFYHTERLNRAGPGLAGASASDGQYWNGNWSVRWIDVATGQQQLQAISDHFTLKLRLNPEKPLVINGKDGVSRKGPLPGEASHYISFTRLKAEGGLTLDNAAFSLSGLAWMDHEFFTEPRDNTLAGWDWFSVQLENGEDLMLYRLRRISGEPNPYSSGTYIDAQGHRHYLEASQFSLTPAQPWRSPVTGAQYPLSWTISIPSLQLQLSSHTQLKNQELFSETDVSPSYWEGAVTYVGTIHSQPARGVGYVELTGYAKAMQIIGK
jgi:predicted secreted hydrolase